MCRRAAWKLGSLEVWRLGGATEVKARPAALGGDETERCAAITVQAQRAKPSTAKNTKDHKETPCRREAPNLPRLRARRRGTADFTDLLQIKGVLARGADAPRRTENRACRREAPNLPRPRRTERPCGATGEAAMHRCAAPTKAQRLAKDTK